MKKLIVAAGVCAFAVAGPALAADRKPPPKLVVVIAVDQLSTGLFTQYRPLFTGGLKTLSGGLVYANGFQSHAATETCPGHSTILTGKHPYKTGIPANDWIDRSNGESHYCFYAPQNTLADGGPGENGKVGPDQMTATTLGDWLKAVGSGTRVFTVAGKDRGAIALGGQKGDGAFWYLKGFGFTTFVRPGETAEQRLAPVAALNATLKARFEANPPGWTYQHDVCRTMEGEYQVGDQTYRTTLPQARFVLENSPILDEITLEAAETLLTEQKLGQGAATDLLGVSLSGTDRIGHGAGTQGPEMCEQLLRLDAALGRFLQKVEALPGGAVVVLTADHGGSDFPERSQARGMPEGQRIDFGIRARLNAALKAKFKLDYDPVKFDGAGLYVFGPNDSTLAEGRKRAILAEAVRLLKAEPQVEAVFTGDEIGPDALPPVGKNPEEMTLRERYALSYVPERSADALVAFKFGITLALPRLGGAISSHGTPWDYDRKVPILIWWPGAPSQERFYPISTTDIAPTLANLLSVPPPADVDGRCLDLGGFEAPACPVRAPAAAKAEKPVKSGFRWPWS